MYDKNFAVRLAKLRMNKGVSAREMSLSIGQNVGYINNIETGKALPSMMGFFYICEYFGLEPKEFFDFGNESPECVNKLSEKLKSLNLRQLEAINILVDELTDGRANAPHRSFACKTS